MMNPDRSKKINESPVPPGTAPSSLLCYLTSRFTYFDEAQWTREIASGKVLVSGNPAADSHMTVKEGDLIAWTGRGTDEPTVDSSYCIIHETPFYLAVNKPGDLPVHPAGRYFNNTLTALLEKDRGMKVYPVHRIDRETSGLVLLALSPEAAGRMSSALTGGVKEYTAIVQGNFPDGETVIDLPLGPDLNSAVRKKRSAYSGAQESARTVFTKILSFASYSLIRAVPETGRLHQIRIHCESAGYPILGDKLYGGDDTRFLRFIDTGMTDDLAEELVLPRSALHAAKITLRDPFTEKMLSISAPMPQMFSEFIRRERSRG